MKISLETVHVGVLVVAVSSLGRRYVLACVGDISAGHEVADAVRSLIDDELQAGATRPRSISDAVTDAARRLDRLREPRAD